ncbi:MAG: hypothetical protein G01um101429_687 [Parcubacteria group bacterium Gr01-1014_29]|nr:MAG: hypothetical protein G01um101429_687 [Parcubacteria group bacterium Gr01-1014_29]
MPRIERQNGVWMLVRACTGGVEVACEVNPNDPRYREEIHRREAEDEEARMSMTFYADPLLYKGTEVFTSREAKRFY